MPNYNQARAQIKSGDVLAWTHKGWRSFYDFQVQMIRVFTRSEYCHIGVAWVVGSRVFVIEAAVPQVRIYPLSKVLPFYWIPTNDYWTPEVEEYALSLVGSQYSKMEAIRGFLGTVITGQNHLWQCAELTDSILVKGNVLRQEEAVVTPAGIVEELMKQGLTLTYINA
jgi:hypothetical protein